MTEKVNPSQNRPIEAFKTAGAIAYGGHGDGFVSPSTDPTDISVQDSGISEADLNAFGETSSSSSFDVTIDGGEAFVFGSWLAIDTDTTVTLASSTTGQTVYVGWNKDTTNDVIIGLDSAFSTASGDTDERISLWTFDTDGSGVTNVVDERSIGQSPVVDSDIEIPDDTSTLYGSDGDFSIQYNSTSDELEIIDETTDTVKQTFDKNGDVHIPNGALDMRNNNSIDASGTESIAFDGTGQVDIPSGDLTDGTNVIYSQTNNWVPQTRLENDTLTVAGNSVSLGGSTTVLYTELDDTSTSFPIPNTDLNNSSVSVAGQSVSLGGSTSVAYTDLGDTGTSFPIPNTDLNNSSVSVAGNSVSLGGSTTVDYVDLNDTGISFPIPNSDISNTSVSVAGNSVTLGNSTSVDHADLSNIGSDQHHSQVHGNADHTTNYDNYNNWTIEEGDGENDTVSSGEKLVLSGGADMNAEITSSGATTDLRFALNNNSVTVAGNSVSLGGSTTVDYVDLNDTGNSFPIPNTDLNNSSVSVAGNSVSLGGSTSVAYVDLNDTGNSFPIPNTDLNNSSVSVAGNSVSLGGSTAINHSDLSNISSSQHHAKYTDEEAQDASATMLSSGTDLTSTYDDANNTYTFDHADTSTQGNVSTSGSTIVDSANLDGRGHVTNINTASRSIDQWADANGDINMAGNSINNIGSGGGPKRLNLPSTNLNAGEYSAMHRIPAPTTTLEIYYTSVSNGSHNAPTGLNAIVQNETDNVTELSQNSTDNEGNPTTTINVNAGDNITFAVDNGNFTTGTGSQQIATGTIVYEFV